MDCCFGAALWFESWDKNNVRWKIKARATNQMLFSFTQMVLKAFQKSGRLHD